MNGKKAGLMRSIYRAAARKLGKSKIGTFRAWKDKFKENTQYLSKEQRARSLDSLRIYIHEK